MLLSLFVGFLLGAGLVLFIIFVLVVDPFGNRVEPPFVDQFKPIQIAPELRKFLKSGEDGQGISKWESTFSLTLFLHMFYQEHKNTRQLRRWFHKRLQLELNDITTRSAAGRLIQDIRVRDLCMGTKFPTINAIRVEKVELADDKESFENVTFLIDMEYTGGFETSIDVQMLLGGYGNLSIKVSRLAGMVRLILSRKPFNHWAFAFVSTPVFEFDITSQIQGHRLKHVIPLIAQQIRRAVQRKHVWPNYKIRYRPIFPNPLLQPSPPLGAFEHVKLEGGLEVTVLQCSRLKTSMLESVSHDVYCTVSLDQRPFLQNAESGVSHSISVLLTFSRYDAEVDCGLLFQKPGHAYGVRAVRVSEVVEGSPADKAGFKSDDVVIAINNIPVRSERQVEKLLSMKGDLLVLVERDLDDIDYQSMKEGEVLVGDTNSADPDAAYVCLGELDGREKPPGKLREDTAAEERSESPRRHSLSMMPESSSVPSDSLRESLASTTSPSHSVNSSVAELNRIIGEERETMVTVSRTESARVPQVIVRVPSVDLRRTRSESQIDVKTVTELQSHDNDSVEDLCVKKVVKPMDRMPISQDVCLDRLDVLDGLSEKSTLKRDQNMTTAGSEASLLSSVSNQSAATGMTTGEGSLQEADDEAKLTRSRPASTRRQRLHTALAAGKRKVFDLIPQKKRSSPQQHGSTTSVNTDTVEVGTDAGEVAEGIVIGDYGNRDVNSPCGSSSRRSPTEYQITDEKKDCEGKEKEKEKSKKSRVGRKKKGLSPMTPRRSGGSAPSCKTDDSPSGSSTGFGHSKSTRAVHLMQNVLWGQSLHFELDTPTDPRRTCKYLNVTVHARQSTTVGPEDAPATDTQTEPKRPVLLGYTSLYIPQLIDDCKLTLSNCHREVFHLKPPPGPNPAADRSSPASEFSRHAGYDPRLMYGDVTLAFRFFPDGFPEGVATNAADLSDDDVVHSSAVGESSGRPLSPPGTAPQPHEWKTWTNKQGGAVCALCRGKIWLKNAAMCSRCLVVCHVKCQVRANTGIACTPSTITENDNTFEDILDTNENDTLIGPTTEESPFVPATSSQTLPTSTSEVEDAPSSIIPSLASTPSRVDTDGLTRRSRLKSKVSEKWSNWRRKKGKNEDDISSPVERRTTEDVPTTSSPMASIATCLADVLPQLEGSPFIEDVYFQPGNAYNEETIGNAKRLGKQIFEGLPPFERKEKINEQIDRIQNAIRETKDGRLDAMTRERKESESEGGDGEQQRKRGNSSFEGLDERLQALAVLMLHYCAALQDWCEKDDFGDLSEQGEVDEEQTEIEHPLTRPQHLDLEKEEAKVYDNKEEEDNNKEHDIADEGNVKTAVEEECIADSSSVPLEAVLESL